MLTIRQNLITLQQRLFECETKYHRFLGSTHLLAVTKQQSIEKISQAIAAGQLSFGENYLQEALPKIGFFADKNVEWHFIGTIQTNKIKKIAENFSWVQSVTSEVQAQKLSNYRPSHLPPLNICIEVNVSREVSKSGALFKDIFALAEYCSSLPKVVLRGLMALPAPQNIFSAQREEFRKLADLFKNLNESGYMLDTLSMGMSNDWEAAVAEGATMIRIGTSLFGPRN